MKAVSKKCSNPEAIASTLDMFCKVEPSAKSTIYGA